MNISKIIKREYPCDLNGCSNPQVPLIITGSAVSKDSQYPPALCSITGNPLLCAVNSRKATLFTVNTAVAQPQCKATSATTRCLSARPLTQVES